jgi:(2Fe-2S) ferredoxin
MQREHERSRLTAEGKRTDDGDRCTLLVVCETGGTWAVYPHGADQLGVRLSGEQAERVARAILDGGR